MLVNILDRIREEAHSSPNAARYLPDPDDEEKINQARARAFIHLYLMVSFGLLAFPERERLITDNSYDGGIDAYYIDRENRKIYLIQSKFRATDRNFSSKNILLDELLSMDINRILDGNTNDEAGNPYNGKIKQLIREVSEIDGIARYKYQVILLANLQGYTRDQLSRLCGGNPVEVFDYEKCYERLVFPVVSGTYFNAAELNILLDLSNKNAGSKISYEVKTEHGDCDITVLFVPTIEIARVLSKYKNSILRHNPRSYLDLEGKKVNSAIRETILKRSTNEFALFNNGITMISDDTNINERIGQRSKAQLAVRNPQIINGGQTAFTLSRILEESTEEEAEKAFSGKEVLLKIITLAEGNNGEALTQQKLELIDAISTATNQQTSVIGADRISNDPAYEAIQAALFKRYGLLFERKRGEFGDGLRMSYISDHQVIERNLFFRIYLTSNGFIQAATEKKVFLRFQKPDSIAGDLDKLDNFYFGYLCYRRFEAMQRPSTRKGKEFFSKIYAMTRSYRPEKIEQFATRIADKAHIFEAEWDDFLRNFKSQDSRYFRNFIDRETGESRTSFSPTIWYRSLDFETDVKKNFPASV